MKITVREDTGTVIAYLEGRFTFDTHREFRQLVRQLVGAKHITFDFTKTTYLDSSALGMLLLAKDELSGAEIILQNAVKEVAAVLEIACFRKLFIMK